jgi:hypothetical protein
MGGLVEVLGGVLVLRGIAAAYVTALQAKPQVDPGITHLQALFTAFSTGGDFTDLLHMCTGIFRSAHAVFDAGECGVDSKENPPRRHRDTEENRADFLCASVSLW